MNNRKYDMVQKVLSKIFIFTVLVLPLITWNGFYEGPKVLIFTALGVLLISFWLFRIILLKKNFSFTRTDFFYIAWLFVLTISSVLGIHPLESITGGSYRRQGVIFFLNLWLVYKTAGVLKKDDRKLLYKGLALVVMSEALIVFFQYASGQLYFGKPLGTLGEANAVSGFLAIGTYFVFQSLNSIYYAIPVISLLIAESRAGLLALLPNLFFLIRNMKPTFSKILMFLIVISGVLFVGFVSLSSTTSVFEDRLTIWRMGAEQVISRPFLGFGAESGEVLYEAAFIRKNISLDGLIIDRAHNIFIDVAMWSGITGLFLFTGFLISFYKGLNNKYKKLALISFIIYASFQPLSVVHWLLPFLL